MLSERNPSRIGTPMPMFLLACMAVIGFGVFEGCPEPAKKCITAADCPGANMKCLNTMCVPISDGDSSTPKDTSTPTDTNTPKDTNNPTDTATPKDNTSPGQKQIGEACNAVADCITGAKCLDPGGLGFKICTADCAKGSKTCGENVCDNHAGLPTGLCLPSCKSAGDCKAPFDFCTTDNHCWTKGKIGALCQDATECKDAGAKCQDPGGLGPKICTKTCTSDGDCGADGMCDTHSKFCLPKCTDDASCQVLTHMQLCTTDKHCWRKGNAGSLCAAKRECFDGLECKDPGGLGPDICHKTCSSDADCDIDGTQGKCGDPGSGTKICLPSCTGNGDCANFPHMPTCNNGQCWK